MFHLRVRVLSKASCRWARGAGVGCGAGAGTLSALPPAEEFDAVRTELLPRDAIEEEIDSAAKESSFI